jgi:hypothetical protein
MQVAGFEGHSLTRRFDTGVDELISLVSPAKNFRMISSTAH